MEWELPHDSKDYFEAKSQKSTSNITASLHDRGKNLTSKKDNVKHYDDKKQMPQPLCS